MTFANLQLQRLKLAYEVKENTLSAKSDELKAAQNKLKQLNFDQNKAQYDLNGLKAKLEKAKQSEENLRTTLFQKDTLLRFLNDAPNEDVDWRTTIAKAVGGQGVLENGLLVHPICNRMKSDLSLEEIRADLFGELLY